MSLTHLGTEHIAAHLYSSERVHVPVASPAAITAEHMRFFKEQGFLAVNNVYTAEEVASGKAGLSHLIQSDNTGFKGVQFEPSVDMTKVPASEREPHVRKLMDFVDFEPRLKALAEHKALLDISRRLLGSDITLTQAMALLKPAHIGTEKPWHQDNAYFLLEPLDMILGTWTALDAATVENGRMHVIPGSHLGGPVAHYHDRDCQLPDEVIKVEEDVVVPLAPGGTLFFYGLLHHGTPPNRSAERRRALQFHYASVNCKKITFERHQELFADAKGYAACAGWAANLPNRPIADRAR